ncbi:MAG: DUF2868 domain-containing protein [Burkholderiales bacterium]|nr:DUF2868 domain-containing protein [Burkholderiales bacterium]
MASPAVESRFDEDAARRVLLVQAYDASPADNPLWTPEDRSWATRLAIETTPADATLARFVQERAHHALQRLLPRDAAAARLLRRRLWQARRAALVVAGAVLLGLAMNVIGSAQHINLLAPPVWGVLAWNLVVYAALLWPGHGAARAGRGLRGWIARRVAGRAPRGSVLSAFGLAWGRTAAPLMLARAALVLHAAAAALALGLIAGLYLRGLVLDYRAGWQSTFLDADQVRAVLALLLAPASAVTGIAVPDAAALQALRIGADAAPLAPAAPWLHLYAATLALFVVLPRGLLALAGAWRARRLSRRLPLPLAEPYYQRLQRQWRHEAARVQVLPHGAAPGWPVLSGLKEVLATVLGPDLQMQVAEATAYGDEEAAGALAPAPGTTLRVLLVDLASTPEDEAQGRYARALRAAQPATPLLLVADETGWRARFAGLEQRLAERRVAWQRWADAQGLGFVAVALAAPDLARAGVALEQALQVDSTRLPEDRTPIGTP